MSIRLAAGVAALLILSLWSALEGFQFTRQYNEQFKDPYGIVAAADRYGRIRADLPEGVTELGYVSDKQQNDPQGGAMFFGAQYVLAPRLLVREKELPKHAWIAGNFASQSDFNEVARLLGLVLVRDYGQGVVLMRKESPK